MNVLESRVVDRWLVQLKRIVIILQPDKHLDSRLAIWSKGLHMLATLRARNGSHPGSR